MRNLATRKKALFILLIFAGITGKAQQKFFTDMPESAFKNTAQKRVIIPSRFRTLSLDKTALLKFLNTVTKESGTDTKRNKTMLEIPMPKGDTAKFYIWESSPMAPELAAQFPDIKSYTGQGITDGTATIKIDWTEFGFHAMILSPVTGSVFIDPYAQGTTTNYISYFKQDLKKNGLFIEAVPKKLRANTHKRCNYSQHLGRTMQGLTIIPLPLSHSVYPSVRDGCNGPKQPNRCANTGKNCYHRQQGKRCVRKRGFRVIGFGFIRG